MKGGGGGGARAPSAPPLDPPLLVRIARAKIAEDNSARDFLPIPSAVTLGGRGYAMTSRTSYIIYIAYILVVYVIITIKYHREKKASNLLEIV